MGIGTTLKQIARALRLPNYYEATALVILVVLMTQRFSLRRSKQLLCSKRLWAVVAVLFCLVMVSGQVWNQMRKPQFYHKTKTEVGFICWGARWWQYVTETYIVVILYGAVVGGMILMIEAAGGVRKRSKETAWGAHVGVRRRLQGFVGLVIFCVFFLLILYVFKNKVKNYRFSFFFG